MRWDELSAKVVRRCRNELTIEQVDRALRVFKLFLDTEDPDCDFINHFHDLSAMGETNYCRTKYCDDAIPVYVEREGQGRPEFRAYTKNIRSSIDEEISEWQAQCGYPEQGYGYCGKSINKLEDDTYEIIWSCYGSCGG